MKILYATDYVCPYCMIGKAALKQAIAISGINIIIEPIPMQLTVEPQEQTDTWNDPQKREGYKILEPAMKELGIESKFPPHIVPRPYTRMAFEGHYYACEHGLGDAYDDAMYRAYFVEEKDIGQLDVLADVAGSVGLDREEYLQIINEGKYSEVLKKADEYTKNHLGIHSVPTLVVAGEQLQFTDYTVQDAMNLLKTISQKLPYQY